MKTRCLSTRFAIAAAVLLAIASVPLGATRARATFVFTLMQTGNDVTVTGTGTIDTTGLGNYGTVEDGAHIFSYYGLLVTGPADASTNLLTAYHGVVGPTSFGQASGVECYGTGSGSLVGITASNRNLYVPIDYVSGTELTTSAIFPNKTFSDLGFTPGTYTYTWGSGDDADSMTVAGYDASTPEPSTWFGGILLSGAVLFRVAQKRRRTSMHRLA